ncbi:hypothetical protein Syun_027367 [Stephania yunnanensis]|uniref:Uncharacterized protein n=1 Tax=Stephania yunnanensis TaxID=152371 RepID=A0AAP0EFI6_9MAGN
MRDINCVPNKTHLISTKYSSDSRSWPQLQVDPNTCVFASTTRDHPIHLWDATSGQILKHEWPARWQSFVPDLVSAAKTIAAAAVVRPRAPLRPSPELHRRTTSSARAAADDSLLLLAGVESCWFVPAATLWTVLSLVVLRCPLLHRLLVRRYCWSSASQAPRSHCPSPARYPSDPCAYLLAIV